MMRYPDLAIFAAEVAEWLQRNGARRSRPIDETGEVVSIDAAEFDRMLAATVAARDLAGAEVEPRKKSST